MQDANDILSKLICQKDDSEGQALTRKQEIQQKFSTI